MSAKHTPGPWHWDSDPVKGDPLGRVRYRVTTTGKTITQCYYSSGDEHAEHDARLIAAAPEMLDALKLANDAMNYLGDILNSHDMAEPEDEVKTTPAFRAVHAAIKKATGTA
jgi:hypothetical protein